MLRQIWRNTFAAVDLNQDGVISRAEHQQFFHAWKKVKDPVHASIAFTAIDEYMDGVITEDEYVNAGMDYVYNFTDETKHSKHFFGPLLKDKLHKATLKL